MNLKDVFCVTTTPHGENTKIISISTIAIILNTSTSSGTNHNDYNSPLIHRYDHHCQHRQRHAHCHGHEQTDDHSSLSTVAVASKNSPEFFMTMLVFTSLVSSSSSLFLYAERRSHTRPRSSNWSPRSVGG
eukprot:4534609-Pleurochrysis_carterae.AAC.7